MTEKCDKGYQGDCCCGCKFQLRLMRHPSNNNEGTDNFFKGRVIDPAGFSDLPLYACTIWNELEGSERLATISTSEHGCCEMHTTTTPD